MAGKQFFVSQSGSDLNPGTVSEPFLTVSKGVSVLEAGDVLNLREGTYVESIEIVGKNGTALDNIVIRSAPGEHAFLDGSVSLFRTLNNDDWEAASLQDPDAHQDEFVSVETFALVSGEDRVNRGAFLDRDPYTRLITYSKLEDLRAENQTFDRLELDDPRPGPEETDEEGNPKTDEDGNPIRRPWVYMGPGVFFSQDETSATGRVHIRLSHTQNNVPRLPDYNGTIDPRKVRLAISHKERVTLIIRNSSYLRLEDLSIRFGGESTVEVRKSNHIMFDHVRVRASSHGVFLKAGNEDVVLRHCELDGGLPPWYFRTDRKSGYHFKVGDTVFSNNLGEQTSRALLIGNPNNVDIEFHNCEFVNAHDVNLFGRNIKFHHNWIDNVNDEAMFVDAFTTDGIAIFQNVITRCLSAISFAGNKIGGRKFVYRNLIDLRGPTLGFRPRFVGDRDVFRFGHLFKSNPPNGPLDLFQNTCVVFGQDEQASYLHYRDTRGSHPRRSINNILVAINPNSDSDRPITFVPSPSFPGPTDGNCYFRISDIEKQRPLFRFLRYTFNKNKFAQGAFDTLGELQTSQLFEQSKTQYAPGYEANSINADPRFRQMAADGSLGETDDFRLRPDSPANGAGVVLPPKLKMLDPVAPSSGKPDIGCYQSGQPPLRVGVDGRMRFPKKDI